VTMISFGEYPFIDACTAPTTRCDLPAIRSHVFIRMDGDDVQFCPVFASIQSYTLIINDVEDIILL
jgi:hypothetical protein